MMKGHGLTYILWDPSLLHLSPWCGISWEHRAFLCLVKTLPVQLHLCRFSTSFPVTLVIIEVCQCLGTCSVIMCMKLWIKNQGSVLRHVTDCQCGLEWMWSGNSAQMRFCSSQHPSIEKSFLAPRAPNVPAQLPSLMIYTCHWNTLFYKASINKNHNGKMHPNP